MQERHLYEYAVIRFVPRVEREEFINVGIVLFSKRCKYLKSLYTINENKLKLFSSCLLYTSGYDYIMPFHNNRQ